MCGVFLLVSTAITGVGFPICCRSLNCNAGKKGPCRFQKSMAWRLGDFELTLYVKATSFMSNLLVTVASCGVVEGELHATIFCMWTLPLSVGWEGLS